jgi:hypothetical protein
MFEGPRPDGRRLPARRSHRATDLAVARQPQRLGDSARGSQSSAGTDFDGRGQPREHACHLAGWDPTCGAAGGGHSCVRRGLGVAPIRADESTVS